MSEPRLPLPPLGWRGELPPPAPKAPMADEVKPHPLIVRLRSAIEAERAPRNGFVERDTRRDTDYAVEQIAFALGAGLADSDLVTALLGFRHINTIELPTGVVGLAVRNAEGEQWRMAYAPTLREAALKVVHTPAHQVEENG